MEGKRKGVGMVVSPVTIGLKERGVGTGGQGGSGPGAGVGSRFITIELETTGKIKDRTEN